MIIVIDKSWYKIYFSRDWDDIQIKKAHMTWQFLDYRVLYMFKLNMSILPNNPNSIILESKCDSEILLHLFLR